MRQDLAEWEAATVLDELHGKQTIYGMRDILKAKGILVSTAEAIEQWELEQTRKIIRAVRRYRNREGTGRIEFVNLFQINPDGTKEVYYRRVEECNLKESVQLLQYWDRRGRACDRQFYHYHAIFLEKHGEKLQQALLFVVPQLPRKGRKKGRKKEPVAQGAFDFRAKEAQADAD